MGAACGFVGSDAESRIILLIPSRALLVDPPIVSRRTFAPPRTAFAEPSSQIFRGWTSLILGFSLGPSLVTGERRGNANLPSKAASFSKRSLCSILPPDCNFVLSSSKATERSTGENSVVSSVGDKPKLRVGDGRSFCSGDVRST